MGQNNLSQSDCRTFLSTISPEEINEIGHGQKIGVASLVMGP